MPRSVVGVTLRCVAVEATGEHTGGRRWLEQPEFADRPVGVAVDPQRQRGRVPALRLAVTAETRQHTGVDVGAGEDALVGGLVGLLGRVGEVFEPVP